MEILLPEDIVLPYLILRVDHRNTTIIKQANDSTCWHSYQQDLNSPSFVHPHSKLQLGLFISFEFNCGGPLLFLPTHHQIIWSYFTIRWLYNPTTRYILRSKLKLREVLTQGDHIDFHHEKLKPSHRASQLEISINSSCSSTPTSAFCLLTKMAKQLKI